MPEPEKDGQVDFVASSTEGKEAEPRQTSSSADSASAIEEQERPATQDDMNPRSPKRPRLSPIDYVDMEMNNEQVSSPVPSTTVSPPAQLLSAPATGPPAMPQPPQALVRSVNSQPPKAIPADQDASKSRTSTPSPQTRLDNLPILSNLAGQLLSVLAKMTPHESLGLAKNVAMPNYQEYRTIRTLLDPVHNLYRTGPSFLIPAQLGLNSVSQAEILRKANQALWLTSIFSGEIGLRDMDQSFLFNFVPEGGKLLKSQGIIFLELKTQAFITAHRVRAADPRVVLADLFSHDMDQRILSRRPGTRSLAPSEHEFLKRLSSRRDILAEDIRLNRLEELQTRYGWNEFNRETSNYISKNYGTGVSSVSSALQSGTYTFGPSVQDQMQQEFSVHDPPMPALGSPTPTALEYPQRPLESYPTMLPDNMDEWKAQLARAWVVAMGDTPPPFAPPPPPASTPTQQAPAEAPTKTAGVTPKMQPQFQHYNPASANASTKNNSPVPEDPEIPHVSQTAPTQVLYERAREAATVKANAKVVPKPDSPSQRRPWTQEEESALMTGLDQVKGPHWSQILAMYGRGGSINESLKDRNQVQLKDKARNLKLFFLKNIVEVPYYLQEVTGDLKSRAPGQAERQERERVRNEENKAHFDGVQGIMALAKETSYDADDIDMGTAYDEEDEEEEGAGEEAGEANEGAT